MSLTILSEIRLSALQAPYGAVLRIEEIDVERARRLVRESGAEMPRPPPYRADRMCEALDLPPELGHKIKVNEKFLVCECQGFRAVIFYLVEFVRDIEEDEEVIEEIRAHERAPQTEARHPETLQTAFDKDEESPTNDPFED